MTPHLTPEDCDAFADFRSEVLRSHMEAKAAEQATNGGPQLTEMGMPEISDWLRHFHGEIRQHLRDINEAEENVM